MVQAEVVAVLAKKLENRELNLIKPVSRVMLRGEIHELILTDEKNAGPEKKVNRIAYLCFFEVKESGLLLVGDKIWRDKMLLGEVAGFDETHAPNHLNVLIVGQNLFSGRRLGLKLGDHLCVKE